MGIEEIVEDWPGVKKRWEAWWQFEMHDRPLLAVTAPKSGVPERRSEEVSVETQWIDAEYMVRRQLAVIRTTYYGGEAMPAFWHNWSAGHALYFGCRPHFAADTVWVDPAPAGPDGYPSFEGWQESPWWAWMQESTRIAVAGSQGRYLVMPMWGNQAGDNLSLVRGGERLLIDMVDNPAWVKRAIKTLSDIQIQVYEVLWDLVAPEHSGVVGSINYVGCWSPGRTMGFDCDISCMISDKAFKEIFLPPLLETMHTVDHRIYHLDGWVALHHLDTLLGLPELQAIQWVPGAGREAIAQWIPLIKRIQARRKSLSLAVQPDEVLPLLRQVGPEGLYLSTHCPSESEARHLVDCVAALF